MISGIPANEHAWSLVLDALENALDLEDVHPDHRAALARMHEEAGAYVGIQPLVTPERQAEAESARKVLDLLTAPWDRGAYEARQAKMRGPGGIGRLRELMPHQTYSALTSAIWRFDGKGIALVDELERLDRETGLITLRGIGWRRAEQIRAALAQYRAKHLQVVETEGRE